MWVKNPDLPETRSEMALPLTIGQQVIGVLDVQSTEAAAFSTEDVATLRVLADQIAVAIRNAQLFEESQQTLSELRRVYGQDVQHGWATRSSAVVGYRYTPAEVKPLTSLERMSMTEMEQLYVDADNTLHVPLQMAGTQSFGHLRLKRVQTQPWTRQEMVFVNKAVQDVAQALEVSRLLEESRQTATREQLTREITASIRQQLDLDAVLQTAIREMGDVLNFAKVEVRLGGDGESGGGV